MERYKLIGSFFAIGHEVVAPYQKPDPQIYLEGGEGRLHTLKSIYEPSGFRHYDFWKFAILKHGGKEGLRWLTEQKESL